jgi:NAD+ synthase
MSALSFRLALAQLDPVLGDVAGNAGKARAARREAVAAGAELVMFPELFLSGYPPEDLVLAPAFQDACRKACEELARETADGGPAVLIGLPWREGGALHNACALLDGGMIQSVRFKVALPDYGVFDEARIFVPGPLPGPVVFRDKVRLGLPVCEDIWSEDVVECLAETGAELLLSPNGSPYRRGVIDERMNVAVARVVESGLPLVYLNQIGGQDELVFDGASFVLNADRTLAAQLPAFRERLTIVDWAREGGVWRCRPGDVAAVESGDEADYAAIVLGLRDYVAKTGFRDVVLGLSGGIDSGLCAAIATDALGPQRVLAAMLPSRFTAPRSLADARACAEALGIRYETAPIADAVAGLEAALVDLLPGIGAGLPNENLQARLRGLMLMALSNAQTRMLVTTGNKSEMSVGYATLYGDMNGGFNPLKDVYKTQAFRLAALRNRWKPDGALGPDGEVIPQAIIERPPSAELREGQADQDTLPPYEVLDAILDGLVERNLRVADIVGRGHDPVVVAQVEALLRRAEYKRRQAPPGVKITPRNLGRDRRYPIVNGFVDRGAPAHKSDAALVRGIGKASDESVDL